MHTLKQIGLFLAFWSHPDHRGSLSYYRDWRFATVEASRGKITVSVSWRPERDWLGLYGCRYGSGRSRTYVLGPRRWPLLVLHLYRDSKRCRPQAQAA